MANEQSATRGSQDELLRQAVVVLKTKYERQTAYTSLSPTAAAELSNALEAVALAEDDLEGVDREEAIALAHRLVDDDNPELSPLWPAASS